MGKEEEDEKHSPTKLLLQESNNNNNNPPQHHHHHQHHQHSIQSLKRTPQSSSASSERKISLTTSSLTTSSLTTSSSPSAATARSAICGNNKILTSMKQQQQQLAVTASSTANTNISKKHQLKSSENNVITLKGRKRVSVCMGCGEDIFDQFILRVSPDLEWHAACLRCNDCNQYLDEKSTCFVRDGKTYCKNDYVRLFGSKCSNCQEVFHKDDYVMRARHKTYHIRCFQCVACRNLLKTGDEFALRNNLLYCKRDHETIEAAGAVNNNNNGNLVSKNNNNNNNNNRNLPAVSNPPEPPKEPSRAHPELLLHSHSRIDFSQMSPPPPSASEMIASTSSFLPFAPNIHHPLSNGSGSVASDGSVEEYALEYPGSVGSGSNNGGGGGCGGGRGGVGGEEGGGLKQQQSSRKDKSKMTRIRTVLNEKQLQTLRQCYNANPRPDAIMKEKMVEMTGLSPRVIRVWFQNKRCKDKKKLYIVHQLQQQEEKAKKTATDVRKKSLAAAHDFMINEDVGNHHAFQAHALHDLRLHGFGPLIAASPIHHDGGGGARVPGGAGVGAGGDCNPIHIEHFPLQHYHPTTTFMV